MKNRNLPFIRFAIAVVFLFGCSKNMNESCPVCHELNLRPLLTPMAKDYRVGDTMLLVLNLPFAQTHPEHYRPVNLSTFEPAHIPLSFLHYEPDISKNYYHKKNGYIANECEVLAGKDNGYIGFLEESMKRFLPEKKNDAYELRLRIVLKRPGYFSIGSRYGQYRAPNSPECFAVSYPFDATRNNHFIRPIVQYEANNWQEDFYFSVLP